MATIYGTYSCGHEGKVYFPGSRKAVEFSRAWVDVEEDAE